MDYEITSALAGTTSISALLDKLGASAEGLKAVWVSLPAAVFVTPERFGDELELGEGTLRTFDESSCMADALLNVIRELRMATECTCTYGHEGGFQLEAIMSDVCSKKGKPDDIALMRDLAPVMASQAICEEGRALGRAVMQAIDLFGSEIEGHITKKVCAAGSCRAFQTYHILVSKCNGCGECLKVCEDDAILGKPKFVHVVVQKDCTQCNKCLEACPTGAVVTAGAVKPKTPPKPIPCKVK